MACIDIKMRKLPSGGHRLMFWLTSPASEAYLGTKAPNYDPKTGCGVKRMSDLWFEREERR